MKFKLTEPSGIFKGVLSFRNLKSSGKWKQSNEKKSFEKVPLKSKNSLKILKKKSFENPLKRKKKVDDKYKERKSLTVR